MQFDQNQNMRDKHQVRPRDGIKQVIVLNLQILSFHSFFTINGEITNINP